jgi:hypothetical protein
MKAKPPTLTLVGREHAASAADSVRLPTKRAHQADHGPSGPGNSGNIGFIRLNGVSFCQDSRARLRDPQFATLPYPVIAFHLDQRHAVPRCQSVVDANGNMHVPQDYLRIYRYLGTWAVLTDEGQGVNELHIVYASPGALNAFQKTV